MEDLKLIKLKVQFLINDCQQQADCLRNDNRDAMWDVSEVDNWESMIINLEDIMKYVTNKGERNGSKPIR